MNYQEIENLLGNEAENLLSYKSKTLSKELLHIPSSDFIDRVFALSNRNPQVLRKCFIYYGRLANSGYLSILPIDQGIEHTTGSAFAAKKFKTNIKCTGCLAKVTPPLNETVGEDNWEVDLEDPNKTLTIVSDVSENEVVAAVKEAGYEAEKI